MLVVTYTEDVATMVSMNSSGEINSSVLEKKTEKKTQKIKKIWRI